MNQSNTSAFFAPRIAISFALCFGGVLLAMMAWSSAAGTKVVDFAAKIAPEVVAETAEGGSASIVILLADQADVSAADQMQDQDARGWFVYHTLTRHAARTQAALRAELDARGVVHQSFWAANMIVATADRALIEWLAAREDVARIDSNNPVRWIEPPELANFHDAPNSPSAPNTAEWGVTNVNAPSVWAMGFTGVGMVIGEQDTGVRWTHSALKPHYRGWDGANANHNYNWHDSIHSGGGSCGSNTTAPCDDNGHGTHTMGTAVGDDGAGNQVGMAPGANRLFLRDEVFRSGIVGIALSGNLRVETIVAQGCRPIGRPMLVTRCQGNVLFELDQRPPLEWLGELHGALPPRDRELFRHSLFLGLEMKEDEVEYRAGELLVRNLVGIDRASGTIAVGAHLKQLQVAQFLLRDARTATEDLTRLLERYRASMSVGPTGALLFSCLGRGAHLFGRPDHDTDLFREKLGEIPLGGFFCNGEIGPVGGATFLHGYTSAFALFQEESPAQG